MIGRGGGTRELLDSKDSKLCQQKFTVLDGSSGSVLSLEEPINMDKLQATIKFIKSRHHILIPKGKDRQHDKVREVLKFLEEMVKQPKVKREGVLLFSWNWSLVCQGWFFYGSVQVNARMF